jgi:hypothetical protein
MNTKLTPRQKSFMVAYTDPESVSFGNAYQSARAAGYSETTSRNIMHLQPSWLSETIGQIVDTIEPERLTSLLSGIIYNPEEPTLIRLRAIELMMKYYGMLNRQDSEHKSVTINIDLTSGV